MVTRVVASDAAGLTDALELLNADAVIAYPTDTIYGIGGNALSESAVLRVFAAKQRPPTVPLPILLADPSDINRVASTIPALFTPLAKRFWPGGLTLIVPAAAHLPSVLLGGQTTVAVRVPNHGWLRDLIRQFGQPIAGTSANLHGQANPTTAQAVLDQLNQRVPLIIDGGASGADVPSTLVDISKETPVILRQGIISATAIWEVIK